MNIVHLTASPGFGGPERQMLGLAQTLPWSYRSIFLSFAERGLCRPFLDQLDRHGFEAHVLKENTPHLGAAAREVADLLTQVEADVLCCHGYKPDLVGLMAARRAGIPVVAVARGWTAATLKVRCYEAIDRVGLFAMDRVVCVSHGQAAKVRRIGVPKNRVRVIGNAVAGERFDAPDPAARAELLGLFPGTPRFVIGAAGRLSPEKGFRDLVTAAAQIVSREPEAGFVLFGDGELRDHLERQVRRAGLENRFLLPGHTAHLDRFMPVFDGLALSSYTEGMPNVILEAMAAGVPVVATAVGGVPELVREGATGHLVPPAQPAVLAAAIGGLLANRDKARQMGEYAHRRASHLHTFEAQAEQYQNLFAELTRWPARQTIEFSERAKS